jgi:Protein of unknown function (DUF3696)
MTQKQQHSSIIGMKLEGFQVFDKPTYIPLEKITLLFGPNSAGKSSIQDAIDLHQKLIKSGSIGDFGATNDFRATNEVLDLLNRHWRRNGDDGSHVDRMSLSVYHTSDCSLMEAIATDLNREADGSLSFKEGNDYYVIEVRWLFRLDGNILNVHDPNFKTEMEMKVEDQILFGYYWDSFHINLEHPLFRQIPKPVDFHEFADQYPNEVIIDSGILKIAGYALGLNLLGPKEGSDRTSWFEFFSLSGHGLHHDSMVPGTNCNRAITEINILLGAMIPIIMGNLRFEPYVVSASRTVPTRSHLRFQMGNLDDDSIFNFSPAQDEVYRRLAESLAADLLEASDSVPVFTRQLRHFADLTNRVLTDHLFMEQGYRLDIDYRILLSEENSKRGLQEGMSLNVSGFGFLVEICLRDNKGRKHQFQDVGSGIGYILPVLCAICDSNVWSYHDKRTIFIQQPELHIHPALQAAMGDVFIETSAYHQQVIETHSEHLLLRILKRIRQSHLQSPVSQELSVHAKEVCVLYFNPTPDGTTTVKRLRISEDGEFMDRWPRGFFGERDHELFDDV